VTGLLVVSNIVLWMLVILEALALFALYQHFGEMYLTTREGRQSQGPSVGSPLKRVDATDISGVARGLPTQSRPAFLLFASTSCPLCERLRPDPVSYTHLTLPTKA